MGGMKRFIIYLMRWQLSGVILAPCIYLLSDYGSIVSAIVANLIGGTIFYKLDKYLFNKKDNSNNPKPDA